MCLYTLSEDLCFFFLYAFICCIFYTVCLDHLGMSGGLCDMFVNSTRISLVRQYCIVIGSIGS